MGKARIAIVQSLDGHLTCTGPNDFKPDNGVDALEAALGFHAEAGHLPAALYWVEVDLPPLPTIAELKAAAERGEFPKSFIADMEP